LQQEGRAWYLRRRRQPYGDEDKLAMGDSVKGFYYVIPKGKNFYQVIWPKEGFDEKIWVQPPNSRIIRMDIDKKGWEDRMGGPFDVIVVNPPWFRKDRVLQGDVHLNERMVTDEQLVQIKLDKLQVTGECFVWVTPEKIGLVRKWLEANNYIVISLLHWKRSTKEGCKFHVPTGIGRRREMCLQAQPGLPDQHERRKSIREVLEVPVIPQSPVPHKLLEWTERKYPNGLFLELFGKLGVVREGWVTLLA